MVVVAAGEKRAQLQAHWSGGSFQLVDHEQGVLPFEHGKGLAQAEGSGRIGEDRKGIQGKALEKSVALGADGAGEEVAAQLHPFALEQQGFFEPGEQDHAAHRWPGSDDQEAVVAAGVGPGQGGAGPAAQAVGFEPFARQGAGQVRDGIGA